MKKILVTGGSGQLATCLSKLGNSYPELDLLLVDRTTLDISDAQSVAAFFQSQQIDGIINCAAYTAVDKAESEEDQAFAVNFQGVLHLAEQVAGHPIPFMHISTDFVFDGAQAEPYTELDEALPETIYGASKYKGEAVLQSLLPQSLIIRTSWLYSTHGVNFVTRMRELMQSREQLNVVIDQIGTPTNAADLAKVCLDIMQQAVEKGAFPESGIFHYSNEGLCSWFDFAYAIAQLTGSSCQIRPISSREYPTAAKRPAYSVLHKGKIKASYGIHIPYWRDSLEMCLKSF